MSPRQQRLAELKAARDRLNQHIARMQKTQWATTQQVLADLYQAGIRDIRHNDYRDTTA